MKYIYILIFIIISCKTFSQSQWQIETPVKIKIQPFNRLQIVTNLNKAENYQLCVEKLNQLNIFIQANESTSGIKTDILNSEKRAYPYYLTFICRDSVIVVSGKFKLGMSIEMYGVKSEDNFMPIEDKGGNGSAYKQVFTEMKAIADKFGYPVTSN